MHTDSTADYECTACLPCKDEFIYRMKEILGKRRTAEVRPRYMGVLMGWIATKHCGTTVFF
jgi:hypothetical protein